jgi:GntR family transcriptional regulator
LISFAELVLGAGMPIYLQIILYIKRGMAAGTIQNGDEMPSSRVLSALLVVNPNTIQKAYRLV